MRSISSATISMSPGLPLHALHGGLVDEDARVGQGQASDIEIVADEIDRMRSWLEDTLAAHTGRDREKIHADLERDKILTAAAAKEYGIVDQVLTSRKAPASPHSS